jgi:ATP-dependent protease ClpP protease subunit
MPDDRKEKLFIYEVPYSGKHHIVNIDSDIEAPYVYRDLHKLLIESSANDIVTFEINSFGGRMDTTTQIHNLLKGTQARTRAVIYTAYSAASVIALSCDQIITGDHAGMMIHAASWGTDGKVNEMQSQVDYFTNKTKTLFEEVYKGFLNKKEIDLVLNNKDIWLTKNQIDLRLKKWTPIRMRKE